MPAGTAVENDVVRIANPGGGHRVLLVCEHASAYIPARFDDLGLEPEVRKSHIAWDPGALETALALSGKLDSPLVHGTVSRLVYDCNRPPDAAGAMPESSEIHVIPGNMNLTAEQRQERIAAYYRPFEKTLDSALAQHGPETVLVTIHSFTPIFNGQQRSVEIGILHDEDSRLADAILECANGFDVRRNEPYGPADGVTHTLRRHGLPRKLPNVMIEIRNNLVATPGQCREMASRIALWLEKALAKLDSPQLREAAK